jgi:hypothetical protein
VIPDPSERQHIVVDLGEQSLALFEGSRLARRWPVSTARNGAGERQGSECTPRGWHRIRLKVGAGCPPGAVFVARRPTGEIYSPELAACHPDRDWILSRILWLSGTEAGFNRGGDCDTLRRFIYIHGCPDSEPIGAPCSHGCVRMRNADIIELFDRVQTGCRVLLTEGGTG